LSALDAVATETPARPATSLRVTDCDRCLPTENLSEDFRPMRSSCRSPHQERTQAGIILPKRFS
jgi:hypothetical protein